MANLFGSTNLAQTIGLLKNWYAGAIVSQFNDEIPFYGKMQKGNEKAAGLQVVRALGARRNQGIGATSDGGALPNIGVQTTIQATIAFKLNYLRFGITGPMMKASQGDKAAFAADMDNEMSRGVTDLKNDVNRQLLWDGSGTLATVAANAVASTVISITGRESTSAALQFLDIGSAIDIYSSAGALKASNVSVTNTSGSINALSATLTLSSAVTVAATDVIVRAGSFGNEIQGVLYSQSATQTSTIYGVDRSAYQNFQGNPISGAGGQLTLDLLQQTLNAARYRGGEDIDLVMCDFNTERMYNKLLVADRRYVVQGAEKVKGDGTFSSKEKSYLEWAGVPVVPDKDCPQRFMMLSSKTWKKYVLSELEWASESGAELIAQPGTDAYEGRLRLFANIFPEKPSANAVLYNYISP